MLNDHEQSLKDLMNDVSNDLKNDMDKILYSLEELVYLFDNDSRNLQIKQILLDITTKIENNDYHISDLISVCKGYVNYVNSETVFRPYYRDYRAWILKNLAIVLAGGYIDPNYVVYGDIELLYQEYPGVLNYLVQLTELCENPHKRFYNLRKITPIIYDLLIMDYVFMMLTKSKHNVMEHIKDDIDNDEELNDKEWEIVDNQIYG